MDGENVPVTHCPISEPAPAELVSKHADLARKSALPWFAGVGPIEAEGGKALLMAEADTGTDPETRPGTHLIQRERTETL